MLNPKIHLNNIFNDEVKKETLRAGFGRAMVYLGENDERVFGLTGDLADSTYLENFKNKFPERFVDVGVAEQNLATVASGIASMGKIPFISSYSIFSPGRNWEQIRTTICYNNQPVKIIGTHAGLSTGSDGGSHQALEDIAITRVLPRMIVLTPADSIEAEKAVIDSINYNNPVYIRIPRDNFPIITTEKTPFEIGKSQIMWMPIVGKSDVLIISCGTVLSEVLFSAKELEKNKISCTVINLGTVKPLDSDTILKYAKEAGAVVCVEDHQIFGGAGSAVAELLANNLPLPIEFVGVKDVFGESGKPEELYSKHKINREGVIEAVKKVLKRK